MQFFFFSSQHYVLFSFVFQSVDLTKHKLIYDGTLTMKLGDTQRRQKQVELQVGHNICQYLYLIHYDSGMLRDVAVLSQSCT